MRPKGLSPALYSALALATLALIFTTNAAAVSEKVIHNFIIYPHGASPIGNLVADAAGNLYGTAGTGGEHGYGAVFQLTRKPDGNWLETILHSFDGSHGGIHDGWGSIGGLTFDTSGNLYGTTEVGGNQGCPDGCGTVFELAPTAGGKWIYSIIYRFEGKNDGQYPTGGLVFDSAGNLYGTGSKFNVVYESTVFELARSSNGWTGKIIYNFGAVITENLAIDAGGKLYGVFYGQSGNSIFQLVRRRDGEWTEKTLCSDCTATGIPIFDEAGNLYVGADNQVLELVRRQNWKMIVIAEFNGSDGTGASGALTFDKRGNLYGTSASGGDISSCPPYGGCGTAFKLTRKKNGKWQLSVLYKFKGKRDGAAPLAGMIFDRHGALYGTTYNAGDPACSCGTVFELVSTSGGHWKFSVIHRFEMGDGGGPSGLVADASGNLYGVMSQGYPGGGCGLVYELTPSPHAGWEERILYQFKCGTSDGAYPASSLIFDSAGNLYGTTLQGGATGVGTVFELELTAGGTWTESVVYSFTGNADGFQPTGALVFDAVGNLFGTTEYGGSGRCYTDYSFGCGVLYELSPASQGSWTETTLHAFLGAPNDGAFPVAALIFDPAGNLYGTTTVGGNGRCLDNFNNSGCGTIFELSPGSGSGWTESILYNFSGFYLPRGLTLDSHGNLYTATEYGGLTSCPYGCGTVYEFTPSSAGRWIASILYSFGGFKGDGNFPQGVLTLDAMGNLYGTTSEGGAFGCGLGSTGCGTVFRLSPSSRAGWRESVFYSFSGPYNDGASPATGVILDAAGHIYGTTSEGGVDQGLSTFGGTVFEISP
jgi:uncharacterized repeat protein (TIGR03803 family)